MATRRLGFYGFDALALTGGAGHGGLHPIATPEARVRLVGPDPVLAQVLVETGTGQAVPRVAAGSGFGAQGQTVGLPCHLALVEESAARQTVTCGLLTLDGDPVGLLAPFALRPDVTYRVAEVTVADAAEDITARLDSLSLAPDSTVPARDLVFCFTAGTPVDTPDGPRRIEELVAGDLVTTLGNGSQPLRWSGQRHVPLAEMLAYPDLQPVEFAARVIGNASPLRVSPQHRILLNDWRAQVYFGEDEVLIPARAMVNGRTICQVLPPEGVTYVHLLFDRHEIVVADGALSESFHPGETGLLALGAAERREVERLFPGSVLARRRAAFPIVKLTEARALRLPD